MRAREKGGRQTAVETHSLVKRFGPGPAVDRVDLTIPEGGIHALLGPNGAGKTTIIRVLATLLRPSSGHAKVLGYDVSTHAAQVRARIALTGQFASLDEDLTGLENLTLLGQLHGYRGRTVRSRAESLLVAFGLADAARHQVRKYSGGMRRRLDIAASMLVRPELLFLDEPTTGLDPRSRIQVWDAVRTLVSGGTTVVLTTQYLDEADRLADRVTVLDAGRIVAEGPPAELKAVVGSGVVRVRVRKPEQRGAAAVLLGSILGAPAELGTDRSTVQLRVDDPAKAAPAIAELGRQGLDVSDFSLGRPSLDEVFLALTAHRPTPQEATP